MLLLEVSETWEYTCQTTLAATTVNTATASGSANGFTVRDFATATVVVGASATAPSFPNTGVASRSGNTGWVAIVGGLLGMPVLMYGLQKRKLA